MEQEIVTRVMNEGPLIIKAVGLGSARLMAVLFVFPLFSWTRLQGTLRTAIGLSLSLPSILLAYQLLKETPLTAGEFTVLVTKEGAVGLIIGLVLGLPFYAAQAAGDVIDVYRGASAANLFDPVNAQESTVLGTIMILMTLALFVIGGGMLLMIEIVVDTYTAWPMLQLTPNIGLPLDSTVGAGLLAIFRIALVIGGPLLIFLAMVDIGLVFSGKSAKQFNLYDLSNSLRNMILLIILPVYFVFFISFYTDEARLAFDVLRRFLLGQ